MRWLLQLEISVLLILSLSSKPRPPPGPPAVALTIKLCEFSTNDSSLSFKITTGGGTAVVDILLAGESLWLLPCVLVQAEETTSLPGECVCVCVWIAPGEMRVKATSACGKCWFSQLHEELSGPFAPQISPPFLPIWGKL